MTEAQQGVVILVVLLLFVAGGLYVAFRLLRESWPLLRNVFSRDRSVLRRRLLIGLADVGGSILAIFLFFSGEMAVPLVQSVIAIACLAVLVTGLALWLLAALQLIGLAFPKEEKPAEPPAQSNP